MTRPLEKSYRVRVAHLGKTRRPDGLFACRGCRRTTGTPHDSACPWFLPAFTVRLALPQYRAAEAFAKDAGLSVPDFLRGLLISRCVEELARLKRKGPR